MMIGELLKTAGLDLDPEKDFGFENFQMNSKEINKGDVFLALTGTQQNGARYIPDALARGAVGVLTDSRPEREEKNIIYVPQLKNVLNHMVHKYTGSPAEKLFCVGVTGTNGKTTVAKLSSSLLGMNNHKVISLGTIENMIDGQSYPAALTTPNPIELMRLLQKGVQRGCDSLVMETSSHALSQGRVDEIFFDRAIFTNLTQDHLDYHKSMEAYFLAKRQLFTKYLKKSGVAIINMDSEYADKLMDKLEQSVCGFTKKPRVEAPDVFLTLEAKQLNLENTTLTVNHGGENFTLTTSLVGEINIENILAVVTLGLSMNYSMDKIQQAMASIQVPGRNEIFSLGEERVCVVDYAHTPDAIDRVLASFRPLVKGKLCCVFGCGGDRDKLKRPLMAAAVERHCDNFIITNDNPRTENPQGIADDILEGITSTENAKVVLDREAAILQGLNSLEKGDCLVIAGKGHEDYQIFKEQTKFFSDRVVVKGWMKQSSSN